MEATVNGRYEGDKAAAAATLAVSAAGDLRLKASATDAAFANGPSLNGLTLTLEKPGVFLLDLKPHSQDVRFQFINSALVLDKRVSLTYTHSTTLAPVPAPPSRTALDCTVTFDPANTVSVAHTLGSAGYRLKYTYAHGADRLTTMEPCFDTANNAWEFAVTRKFEGGDALKGTYHASNKLLGLEWNRDSKTGGSFKTSKRSTPAQTASADDRSKRQRPSTPLAGLSSGTLGVNSPSLSDLADQRTKKKKKSRRVVIKRPPKPAGRDVASSPTGSATAETPSVQLLEADAEKTQTDVLVLPALAPAPPSASSPPKPASGPAPSMDLADLLGFSLDELDDPEVLATDDYPADIQRIIAASAPASAAVTAEPGMQERLNRLLDEVMQPEAALLANTQSLRNAMATVQADLPPAAMNALLEVCHLDARRQDVESAKQRVEQRKSQQADQEILDKLIADAKSRKSAFDQSAAALKSAKTKAQELELSKKKLEEQLALVTKELSDCQIGITDATSSLAAQRQQIGEVFTKVRNHSAKMIPILGDAKADEQLIDSVQATIGRAAAALSALGAHLPGSGLH